MTINAPLVSLDLSFDGIALLHLVGSEWLEQARIDLSVTDLNAAMAPLLQQAGALGDNTHAVQLFIPSEQIKFLDFDHDQSWDRLALIEHILAHLNGATPYSLDELRYDFCVQEGKVYVAAIAIETLEEAESFVRAYGFDPVGCLSRPDTQTYPHMPYFGLADDPVGRMTPPTATVEHATNASDAPAQDDDAVPEPEQDETPPIVFSTLRSDDTAVTENTTSTLIAQDHSARTDAAQSLASDAPSDATGPVAIFFSRRKPKPAATPRDEKRTAPVIIPSPRTPSADLRNDAEKLTMFGKRTGQVGQDSGRNVSKPVLAAALALLVLAGGAFAYFMSSGPEVDTTIADLTPVPADQMTTLPDTPVAISLPPQDRAIRPQLGQDNNAPVVDQTGPAPLTPAAPPPSVVYSDQELQRIYAATGIWPSAPAMPATDEPKPLGDVYVASIDPTIIPHDAAALVTDTADFGDQYRPNSRPPAPAGTVFELDDLGLVKASPDGALAPDGHLVYLGKPSVVPPLRPEQGEADSSVIDLQKPILSSTGRPLIDLRPKLRPETNLAQDQAEAANDALRLLRPRAKPASIEEIAAEATQTAPQTESVAALDEGLQEVLKPKARPKGLDTSKPTQRVVAAPEDEGDEASAPTTAPNIPTNAKVSREATLKNAIKLNRVNLLGVYGSGSKKRALIRLSNGKRQMVSVGDTLDGGKVAAIGDTELRYVKRGQSVVLTIPKG